MSDNAKKIARYLLREPLGRGGQGHTFRATDQETGRQVAVKRIRLKGSDGWKPFDLFERECEVLAALSHPGIPAFLDSYADVDAGEFFLVMELAEGKSLGRKQRGGGPLEPAQLWNILHQALEILGYLHSLSPPVIHRDVKPDNLVLRDDGRLCLVDFGGVRVALREEGGSTMIGTFGFMAPEQLHGEATPATDIYGLGATLATLATGLEADRLPRKGLRMDLDRVMAEGPLRELLRHMLEPDPADRPASSAAVSREATRLREGPAAADPEEEAEPADEDLPPEGARPDEESPLLGVPGPLMFVLQIVGSMGYVGLVLLDAVFLPVIFAMLGAASGDEEKKKKLEAKRLEMRRVLRGGRRTLKALARGKNPYPGSDRSNRNLPPGPRPPRRLPPGRGRGGRGGRGRRGHF